MIGDCVAVNSWHHLVYHERRICCDKCGCQWRLGSVYAREDDGSEWVMLESYLPSVEKDQEPSTPPAVLVDPTRKIREWAKKTGGRYDR